MDTTEIRDSRSKLKEACDDLMALRSVVLTVSDHPEYANATHALKVIDRAEDGTLTVAPESVDRGRIWGAQTPQIFHSELLKEAYTQGFDTSFTDDASVASRYGIPVTCIQGERTNIKITTPEDLSLARLLLK